MSQPSYLLCHRPCAPLTIIFFCLIFTGNAFAQAELDGDTKARDIIERERLLFLDYSAGDRERLKDTIDYPPTGSPS